MVLRTPVPPSTYLHGWYREGRGAQIQCPHPNPSDCMRQWLGPRECCTIATGRLVNASSPEAGCTTQTWRLDRCPARTSGKDLREGGVNRRTGGQTDTLRWRGDG